MDDWDIGEANPHDRCETGDSNGGGERDGKNWSIDGDNSDIHCEPGVGLSNTGEEGNISPGPQLNSVSLVSGWNWGSLIGDENGESMSGSGPVVKLSSADSSSTDIVASSSFTVVSELGQELALGEGGTIVVVLAHVTLS